MSKQIPPTISEYIGHYTKLSVLEQIIKSRSLRATHYDELPREHKDEFKIGLDFLEKKLRYKDISSIFKKSIGNLYLTCFSRDLNSRLLWKNNDICLVFEREKIKANCGKLDILLYAHGMVSYDSPYIKKGTIKRLRNKINDSQKFDDSESYTLLKIIIFFKHNCYQFETEDRFVFFRGYIEKKPYIDIIFGDELFSCITHLYVKNKKDYDQIKSLLDTHGIDIPIELV